MGDVLIYKGIEKTVAVCVETQAQLDATADVVASVMRSVAAPHGSLASRVTVERGRVDRYVGINDPNIGAIENGGVRRDGRVVQGLHVLARTANMFGSG